MSEATSVPSLLAHVPVGAALSDGGAILDRFLSWVESQGITPYDAQEEALLELMDDKHVVLSTPTGSGKSLVALGLHFKAMCEGRRSFYTAPIKALVSEKFFALCEVFGHENVGMLTGDASINWAAPVICCTQEVLANMALRQGPGSRSETGGSAARGADAPYVVVDEFHYYADRDRGHAWQVPLLVLESTQFLLMSATIGNTAPIEERIAAFTGRELAHVHSDERPVPLDFAYRETPLHETVEKLLDSGRAPVYVVNFTQREAAEVAGGLTSAKVTTSEDRKAIAEQLASARFDTPYGKEMKRILSHGIGLHHAGLLPKYRRLVEQLAQQGLLRVIAGTDTLGVGVNIPIRTVLFTRLSKYDGEKVRILSVRDFRQIAGRAGRKGFDEQGSVVCQAPEHVVANKVAAKKAKKGKKERKKGPPPGFVAWNEETFTKLTEREPEPHESRFRVTHGMFVNLLQRGAETDTNGYRLLAELIDRAHVTERVRHRLRRQAAVLFRSLRRAGIAQVEERRALVDPTLQRDFSLHRTLSLYLVEALSILDPDDPGYALDVVSFVESVVEDPVGILRQIERTLRGELIARLKAERVPYEERMQKAEELSYPRPCAELLRETFQVFREAHPWVEQEGVRPKGIAREIAEDGHGFDTFVKRYGLQRMEGTLLRYLSQVGSTLDQSVPPSSQSEALLEVREALRLLVRQVDSSLLEEWEGRGSTPVAPDADTPEVASGVHDLAGDPKALRARVRAQLHALLRALADEDWDEAAGQLRAAPDDPWDGARLKDALDGFLRESERVRFDPDARAAHRTVFEETEPRRWRVQQALVDAEGQAFWSIDGEVDLRGEFDPEAPLFALRSVHD